MTTINLNPSLLASLEGKTAIVTGGANGIGAEIVRLFHSHGANVVVADLSFAQSAADALIASLSPKVVFIPTDILNWASMTSLFIQTKAKFGSIEIVVANAGIMESHMYYDFQDVDEEGNLREPKESYEVLDVNLKGTMNTLRLAMFHMLSNSPCFPDSSRGSVVLVSSTSGYFGGTGVVSYITSKHGVMGLLRASQHVARTNAIRVNAVAPFFTPTHITSNFAEAWTNAGIPANTTQDVAWAVAQTATDDSMRGRCCMVAKKMMVEVEGPREATIPTWVGPQVAELMSKGGKLFDDLGGYPLPNPRA